MSSDSESSRLEIDLPALAQLLHHTFVQPAYQLGGVLGKGIKDAVYGFMYQGIAVQLHLIRGELSDFSRESLERHLEELVDGADIEGAIIMKDIDKDAP